MIQPAALLRDLQRELAALEPEVRKHLEEEQPATLDDLRREHKAATAARRTAASWVEWLDEQITQAAVAWLLGCVFVRFCEDNRLVEHVWLAGPGDRLNEAEDNWDAYVAEHPEHNDRHWILEAFEHLAKLPATKAIFDRAHNPLWRIEISADAAARLVAFWRRETDGKLIHDFRTDAWDTRFLGDLYQDLSESARKRYALLQTPEFVEDFILSRTLDRAIRERGVEGLKLIDPTCGSGHFLLGAFHRILDRWNRQAPGMPIRDRVQETLGAIHGVDINPFAVAIARFRLTIAALRACKLDSLVHAPSFEYQVAVGDSLLHGDRQLTLKEGLEGGDADVELSGFTYATEDLELLRRVLRNGGYDVVVGNPPYITVQDKALNKAYRRYETCYRQYALTVPFCERFFQLAYSGGWKRPGGWVGQITGNSFMTREFGRKLIEDYLAKKVDLAEVIDASGAHIPGHGTPTVILIGRNNLPPSSSHATVRAVLSIRGEVGIPDDPANAPAWRSIVENIDNAGAETPYVSVTDLPRTSLAAHPWSLSGGGASSLKDAIDDVASRRLGDYVEEIGRTTVVGEDDAWLTTPGIAQRSGLRDRVIPFVIGEHVRDYALGEIPHVWNPYLSFEPIRWVDSEHPLVKHQLWPLRRLLRDRTVFGKTFIERKRPWFDHLETYVSKLRTPTSIPFAFVATHNHFVLDRGGKVFNRSAPVIKLPEDATEDDHLRLLGLLNSSTACFWLKQVSHKKGGSGIGRGVQDERWEDRYEFTGTQLEQFPLPEGAPLDRARRLDALARDLQSASPSALCAAGTPTRAALDEARSRWEAVRAEMISVQEELDWEVYRLYGLVDDDLTCQSDRLPPLTLGERAFEIVLAGKAAAGQEDTEWFTRHGSTPCTDLPAHWPPRYRALVEKRIRLIGELPQLALIERPECKRRWAVTPWDKREREALRCWLLDRLEDPALWRDQQGRPRARSVARLADEVLRDQDTRSVLEVYTGRTDYDLEQELEALLIVEAVPFLAAYRYSKSGMRKRAAWEEVWDLQRREDAGEQIEVPVPPRYTSADFAKPSYWRHRGKLDVPKERFILYPGAERDTDRSPVLGWAGWDHLEQALAAAGLVVERTRQDGWTGERLVPLLAGIAELEPWLRQWHGEYDRQYGEAPAAYLATFLDRQLSAVEYSRAKLAAWQPEKARRGRGGRKPAAAAATTE